MPIPSFLRSQPEFLSNKEHPHLNVAHRPRHGLIIIVDSVTMSADLLSKIKGTGFCRILKE